MENVYGYEIAGISEKGLVRRINQDSIFYARNEESAICLVADGMGGHSHGEIASQAIRQSMVEWWNQYQKKKDLLFSLNQLVEEIRQRLVEVNTNLWNEYSSKETCGSTLVILLCHKGAYAVIYAGDSRIYCKRNFSFKQVTKDEVWENQTSLNMKEEDKKKHPYYGKLLNALGADKELSLQIMSDSLKGKELYLLCSDGVYKMCSDKVIKKAMQIAYSGGENLNHAVQFIREEVMKGGARDNFSVVILKVVR